MENNRQIPRLFLHPTIHNEYFTTHEMFVAVDSYLNSLALHTHSHLIVYRGYEAGWNKHEHDIVCVWSDELNRFNARYESFCHDTAYSIGLNLVMDFDESQIIGAYNYVAKHEAIPEKYLRNIYCSNRYARCKRDKHICRYDPDNPIHLKGRLK